MLVHVANKEAGVSVWTAEVLEPPPPDPLDKISRVKLPPLPIGRTDLPVDDPLAVPITDGILAEVAVEEPVRNYFERNERRSEQPLLCSSRFDTLLLNPNLFNITLFDDNVDHTARPDDAQ